MHTSHGGDFAGLLRCAATHAHLQQRMRERPTVDSTPAACDGVQDGSTKVLLTLKRVKHALLKYPHKTHTARLYYEQHESFVMRYALLARQQRASLPLSTVHTSKSESKVVTAVTTSTGCPCIGYLWQRKTLIACNDPA